MNQQHHSAVKAHALREQIVAELRKGPATQKQLRLTVGCGSGTMSRHMNVLVLRGDARFSEKRGRGVFYSIGGE